MKAIKSTFLLVLLAVGVVACEPTPEPNPNENNDMPTRVGTMHKSAKRGVAYSFSGEVMDLVNLGPYITWDYNWGNTPTTTAAAYFDGEGIDYCPMCWNGRYDSDKIRKYVAEHPSTKYLLAFNEPNLTDQANMTPSQAAELWPPVVALAKELNLKLVSPAMNYGTLSGYFDPIKWLDEFFSQPGVSIDDVDAISLHCYMGSAAALIGFVERFKKYNKPIWMTEFCAWENVSSEEGQMDYMCGVLNYFEQEPAVERYAWFIPRYKAYGDAPYMQLINGYGDATQLTPAGKVYCMFSSFDKTVALNGTKFVHAGEYVELSNNNTTLRPTKDEEALKRAGHDGLMVTGIQTGMEFSYIVNAEAATELVLRYSDFSECIMEVLVDGKSVDYPRMPRTGGLYTFNESVAPLGNYSGTHTITLRMLDGSCYLTGFYLR